MTEHKLSCCGQEMAIHGIYCHCMKCANRVILFPEGKEKEILENLIVEFVQTFEPQWKIFSNHIHELWKEGTYEDYEAKNTILEQSKLPDKENNNDNL